MDRTNGSSAAGAGISIRNGPVREVEMGGMDNGDLSKKRKAAGKVGNLREESDSDDVLPSVS
jgi:hypothetical protein